MSLKELADVFFELATAINWLWGIYLVGVGTVVGWIVSLDRRLSYVSKVLIATGFLAFISLNLGALVRSYTFIEAVRLEMQEVTQVETFESTMIFHELQTLSYRHGNTAAWWVHSTVDIGVLVLIFSDKLKSKARRKRRS